MSSEEARATIQNTESVDVNFLSPAATLKKAHERTQLKVSGLDELNKADKALLNKMTDLEIHLSESPVNSQNIDEALEMLNNCSQLNTFRLKIPKLEL